jgi:group I intron endonuclease
LLCKDGDFNVGTLPVATYDNFEIQKDQILRENSGECGVYRLTNITNKKTYVGSAIDLRTRFYVYYSTSRLTSSKMAIYKAIQKYGYSNFTLDILEYCDPKDVLVREQYYLDSLKPEYNILSTAGSSFGYKHTEETLDKFKLRVFSDEARANLAASATGRVLSEDTKAKISAARSGKKLSAETRAKLSVATAAIHGVAVEVTNIKTGVTEQFSTMTNAAASLGVSRTTVKNIIRTGKILRGSYSIKLKD